MGSLSSLAYWINTAKKLAAPVEGRITHNQWIRNPENAAKLGVTVEEAAKAHPDLVTIRQLGRNTDINPMADGAMTDQQLRRITEMIQGMQDLNPSTVVRVGDSVGNLYKSPSMMEFLGAERVKDLPQGWKNGGVAKMAEGGNKFKPITGNTPRMLRDAQVDRSVMDGNMPDPNDMSTADKLMFAASLIPAGRGALSAYKALSPLAKTAATTVGPAVAFQDPSMMIPNPAAALGAMSGDADAMFVGPKTLRGADYIIDAAKRMMSQGMKPQEIWKETGELFGKPAMHLPWEGRWVVEVPDDAMKLKVKNTGFFGKDLDEVVSHPDLIPTHSSRNWPGDFELARTNTSLKTATDMPRGGSYNRDIGNIKVRGSDRDEVFNTLSHEMQHRIDDLEGGSSGFSRSRGKEMVDQHLAGNSEKLPIGAQVLIDEYLSAGIPPASIPRMLYDSAGGEILANMTAARLHDPIEKRIRNYPLDLLPPQRLKDAWVPNESIVEKADGGSVDRSPRIYTPTDGSPTTTGTRGLHDILQAMKEYHANA